MTEQEIKNRLDTIEGAQIALVVCIKPALLAAKMLNPLLLAELTQAFENTHASMLASSASDRSIQKFDEIAETIVESLS